MSKVRSAVILFVAFFLPHSLISVEASLWVARIEAEATGEDFEENAWATVPRRERIRRFSGADLPARIATAAPRKPEPRAVHPPQQMLAGHRWRNGLLAPLRC